MRKTGECLDVEKYSLCACGEVLSTETLELGRTFAINKE